MMINWNKIMFSINPIEQARLDGGEIWVWDGNKTPASFLKHFGHIWDTKFPVEKTFNMFSENINVLEFVSKYHLTVKGAILKDKDIVFIDALLKGFGDGLVSTLENTLLIDGDDLMARVLR